MALHAITCTQLVSLTTPESPRCYHTEGEAHLYHFLANDNEGSSCEESTNWNNSASSKAKDDPRLKTVRFCADVENPVFPVISDNGNSQRRVPLQTTPINIFNQIIPVRALESALPKISKFESAGAPSTKGTNSSIRETLISKV
ncbi:unnamed protein product, partial [Allacma fusca]